MLTVLQVILALMVFATLAVAHLFREHVNYKVQATIRFLKDWKQSRGQLRETGRPIENDEICSVMNSNEDIKNHKRMMKTNT